MKKYNIMLLRKIITLFIACVISLGLKAQSGPGGVGNSDGSGGQPQNVIWISADSLSLADTDPVSSWSDLSGNSNDLTQGTASAQPQYRTGQINGLPAVVFDGTDDYMPFDGTLIENSDYTVIFVGARQTSNTFKAFLGGTTSAANENLHLYWYNSTQFRAHQYGNDLQTDMVDVAETYSDGTGTGEYGIFATLLSSSDATDQRRNYQNNSFLGSRSNNAQLSSYTGAAIGRYTTGYHDINAAEIIIYSNALNDAQLQIVYEYLGEKYGITIFNDLYTPSAGYNYGLIGIGEESNGEHSNSKSAGFYLSALSGLNVGDYIFASHNNLTNNSANFRTDAEVVAAGAEEAYNRIWYIDTVGTPAAKIAFDFDEALEDGLNPTNITNYVLLYRSGTSGNFSVVKNADGVQNGNQVYFNLTDVDLNTGYYTLGTVDATNSPLEGVPGNTWYTLISGDWDDWEIWTLDPSGALPNNPDHLTPTTSPTNTADDVVILTGRTVTVSSNNLNHSTITIEGRLDLQTTTGHSFGEIKGTGRVLMAADNFPSGDASHFYTKGQGEGTVEFYGGSYNLNTAREFYDVEIELSASTNALTLLNDYTINGDLRINTGILKINSDAATTILNLTVNGDVSVESTASITTGQGDTRAAYWIGGTMPADDGKYYHDIFHQFTMYGNFTNRGTVRFTNLNAPDYDSLATNGAVTVRFKGTSNSEVNLYNTTDFYNLIIDKGTDKTYKVNIYSDNTNYFRLFGANSVGRTTGAPFSAEDPQVRKALWVYHGTLQLRGNMHIPSLSEGADEGGNGDYAVGKNARFWIDGANVTVYSTASEVDQILGFTTTDTYTADGVATGGSNQAMSVYGEFKISSGYFGTRNSAGFIFWSASNAQLKIAGGTCYVAQVRSSNTGGGVASYIQTGGTMQVFGNESVYGGEYDGTYPLFGLETSDAVFQMSGGDIILEDDDGDTDPEFYIISDEGNYQVTGGTVTFELQDGRSAQIYSTANFWDLVFDNTDGSGNATFQLDTNLIVANDLTINAYTELDVEDPNIIGSYHDVSISRNFSIYEGSTYTYGQNTTIFNGTEDGEFYVGYNHDDGYEQYLWNLTVNKTQGKKITVIGDTNKDPNNVSAEYYNRLVHVVNDANIISGILDQGRQSIRLFGGVNVSSGGQLGTYEVGTTPTSAYIMFRDGDLTIYSDEDVVFGNIKFNSTGTVTFTSDVYIKRIGYYQGLYNIGTHNLKVDYLHRNATTTNFATGNGNSGKMIYTDANESDGGISLLIHSNGTYTLPLGTTTSSTRYTPAEVIVTNFSDSGYIQINVADKVLGTTDPGGGDILTYYWRVRHEDFTSVPTVEYNFYYAQSDVVGNENQYVPGFVIDENPYTRDADGNSSGIDNTNNIINFDNGGSGHTLIKANYTAGVTNRFNGALDIYYSESTGSYNWSNSSAWHRNSPTGPNFVPTDGSIVKIMGDARINVQVASIADITVLEFDQTNTSPSSENVGRLQFHVNGTYSIGSIRDTGMISFNALRTINLTSDFGDFGSNPESYYLYFGGDATLNSIPTPIPNLMLESATYTIDQDITVGADLIIQGNATVTPIQDVQINDDLVIGYWVGGTFEFPGTGNSITVTVDDDIDFTRDPYSNPQDRNIIVNNPGSASTLEHNLIVKGDIIHGAGNGYDFDLYNASDRPAVVMEFQGEATQRYYRTSTAVPDFYRLIVNKGTSQTDTIKIEDSFTLSGATDGTTKALELQNGILKLDDSNIDFDLSTGGDDFEIPSTACLIVSQGTVNVYGDDNGIWLDGKLLIDGGTVDMINGLSGNGNNYIEYTSSGNSEIEISSGNLWVGSQIRRSVITEEGILSFNQSGGEVQLGVNDGGDDDRGIFEILNAGSSFAHSAGDFYLVNDYRSGGSFASMYFDPETVNLTSGTEIQFGYTSTTAGNGDFTLYAGQDLMNVTVNSTNSPTLTLNIVSLTLEEDLTINTNATFNANGLDLNLYGDFVNSGTFTANQNNTYFLGSTAQQITGATTFYNLYKTTSNQLTLNNDIDVDNELYLNAGTFNDGDNTLSVQGSVNMDITHTWGGSSDGILLNGSTNQVLTGNGTFGKLSINNSADISIPQGNEFIIDGALQLENGVLDISKNLLVLDSDAIIIEQNAFSENNMIQTNISFTDAGVKKYLPAIEPADNYDFIYPIGSEGKYTPVELAIDSVGAGGFIRVKGANEMHPTIVNDSEPCNEIEDTANVLKYHWLMEANGIGGFDATAYMQYYIDDYQENSAFYDVNDYIAARLLLGSTSWNKYDPASFDEGNTQLRFTFTNADDDGISGDYTAGIEDQGGTCEGAIPDEVPSYITISDGDWTNPLIWDTYPVSGGSIPSNGPRGAIAIVEHEVTIPSNYILSYKTTINATGIVKVGSTFGHRLGIVEGTGTLQLERGNLPAGVYDDFFGRSGGTIEFAGTTDYDVLSEVNNVRNLKFSGTGERRLPNLDFEVYGIFTIDGDDATLNVINEHDRDVSLDSNIVFNQGSFDAGIGTSTVTFNGTQTQIISGSGSFTGTNAFRNVIVNNSNGVTLSSPIEVDGTLTFTSGIITTTSVNILTVDNSSETAVTGYNNSNYVDGPMRKLIQTGGNFVFPLGDAGRYGPINIYNTTNASSAYWQAEYYNTAHSSSSVIGSLVAVSANEYWSVDNPTAGDAAEIELRWDSNSDITPLSTGDINEIVVAELNGTDWVDKTSDTPTGDNYDGTVKTTSAINTDPIYYTLGSTTTISAQAYFTTPDDVCEGVSIPVSFSGVTSSELNFTLYYSYNSGASASVTVNALPYSLPTTDGAGTYELTGFEYNNGLNTGTVDNTVITVNAAPAQPTITPVDGDPSLTFCEGGSVILTSSAGTEYLWSTGATTQNINVITSGTYTVQVTDATGCYSAASAGKVVTVNPLPVFTPSAVAGTICFGESSQLDANIGGVGYSYIWSPSGELDASNIQNPLYTPISNPTSPTQITTTFSVTVTDGNSCSDIGTVDIILNRLPDTGPEYHIDNVWGN